MILTSIRFDWSTRVTDGRTDVRAIAYCAFSIYRVDQKVNNPKYSSPAALTWNVKIFLNFNFVQRIMWWISLINQFSDINVSHGSVATRLRRGGTFYEIALLKISWRMLEWKNSRNRPAFDEVLCRVFGVHWPFGPPCMLSRAKNSWHRVTHYMTLLTVQRRREATIRQYRY